ncbi:MAG: glycosyltransferase [Chloroflexota bacterium]
MNVSVIATVYNEGDSLRPLMESLADQTRRPDEIVIVDGGSTDETISVLEEYARWLPLRIVVADGANISRGRNLAIEAAAGPIIAATDAGVVLSPIWLEEIVKPLETSGARVVSGWFESDPYTDFEVAMGATVLPNLEDIDPQRFLPSSRSVAFLKSAWAATGGYPEWLDYCEDLIFDFALKEEVDTFAFAPEAVAYFRPRGSLRSFFKQYYLYARGDGKSGLWLKRHVIRYVTYLVALPIIGRMIWRARWYGWILALAGVGYYCYRPAARLWPLTHRWRPPNRVRVFVLIPIIRIVGDVAKMIGYPVGVVWRLQNRMTDGLNDRMTE